MGKIYLIKCYKNDNCDFNEIIIDNFNVSEIYKIGFTRRDPKKRLKALQTGNPHKMEIVDVFETNFNTKLEANLHQHFKYKKVEFKNSIKSEWFLLNDDDVHNFINIYLSIENNYKILSESNYYFRKLLKIK